MADIGILPHGCNSQREERERPDILMLFEFTYTGFFFFPSLPTFLQLTSPRIKERKKDLHPVAFTKRRIPRSQKRMPTPSHALCKFLVLVSTS